MSFAFIDFGHNTTLIEFWVMTLIVYPASPLRGPKIVHLLSNTSCIATHKIRAGRSTSFHAHGINHHAQTELAKFGEILLSPHPINTRLTCKG
jgi:hypothetical protein